jgi:hypothetical protein
LSPPCLTLLIPLDELLMFNLVGLGDCADATQRLKRPQLLLSMKPDQMPTAKARHHSARNIRW